MIGISRKKAPAQHMRGLSKSLKENDETISYHIDYFILHTRTPYLPPSTQTRCAISSLLIRAAFIKCSTALVVLIVGMNTDEPATNLSQSITMRIPSGDISVSLTRVIIFH